MKQFLITLMVSAFIGLAAFYAGRQSTCTSHQAEEYKFYDTAIDESGKEIMLYVKIEKSQDTLNPSPSPSLRPAWSASSESFPYLSRQRFIQIFW